MITIKKITLLFWVIFIPVGQLAAQVHTQTDHELMQASILLKRKSPSYNPVKAFELYVKTASKGSPKAMNGVGICYGSGVGVQRNEIEALKWFYKAANSGYNDAWYNVGLMHKNGYGTKQNLMIAAKSFEKGANGGSSACKYAFGYMTYKGLGKTQNYENAIKLFRAGAAENSLGSMYFLGLCFRNGYGIEVNIDSAKYWLDKAASKGYHFAKDELNIAEAEYNGNPEVAEFGTFEKPSRPDPKFGKKMDGYNDINGEYSGFVIRYDWSGKKIINKSDLKVTINVHESTFSGSWKESDKSISYINGHINNSEFIFSNTGYGTIDHYSSGDQINFEFKKASLVLTNYNNLIYLCGGLQLYTNDRREPEKPIYVYLERVRHKTTETALFESKDKDIKLSEDLLNPSAIKVYPNPFPNSFQVSFKLEKSQNIEFFLMSISGQIVYQEQSFINAGSIVKDINVNVPVGSYVFRIRYGGESFSSILIKN